MHQQGGDGAAALVQPGFNDGALGTTVGVGLQLRHLGGDQNHLQQLFQAGALLGGDGADDGVAAPLFGNQVVLRQLLLNPVGVGLGLIHLVDGHDNGNLGGLGMVDSLDGLGHNAVVRCHH